MEKTDKETRDFMNVESFSQLPFIRRGPPPKEKAIRLFGKEFGTHDNSIAATEESESIDVEETKENTNTSSESSRKFECHYCCRNFPTSQALGGHQNAHKRERQHAKRAHLQSAMVHSALTEANIYGIMNYRFVAPAAANYHHPSTWMTNTSTRFYGSPYSPPINGSPLALWRNPQTTTTNFGLQRSMMPVFAANEDFKPSPLIINPSTSQRAGIQDHVCLDLHL